MNLEIVNDQIIEKINEKFVKPIEEERDLMAIRRERRNSKALKKESLRQSQNNSNANSNTNSPIKEQPFNLINKTNFDNDI